MNKDELIDLIRSFGRAHDELSAGDTVLVDGAHAGGEYVTKCRVIEVDGDSVKLQEEHTYYLNGGEFPERKQTTVPMEYFRKSIPEHIQQGREVFTMIAKAFDED
ncbi:MAG: hypothetical protein ACPG32_11680 [Akkermansiaceae bacterium]